MQKAEPSTFEVELVFRGDPATSIEVAFSSSTDVQAFVAQSLAPNSVLTVVHLKKGADYGNFLIFMNAMGLAHVRLLEHRGFYARRSEVASTEKPVQFISDVGGMFEVDENATVPYDTALEALNYWLATGQQLSTVCWGEE